MRALKATKSPSNTEEEEAVALTAALRMAKALDGDLRQVRDKLASGYALGHIEGPAHRGDVEEVLKILNGGAYVDSTDTADWTGLMRAACTGKLPVVKVLLDHGAYVDHQSQEGFTALTAA